MQCACVVLSFVACCVLQYCSSSYKQHLFVKKKLLNIKCVFRSSINVLSETYFIPRRTERDREKKVYRSSCELPFILAPV